MNIYHGYCAFLVMGWANIDPDLHRGHEVVVNLLHSYKKTVLVRVFFLRCFHSFFYYLARVKCEVCNTFYFLHCHIKRSILLLQGSTVSISHTSFWVAVEWSKLILIHSIKEPVHVEHFVSTCNILFLNIEALHDFLLPCRTDQVRPRSLL